MGQVVSNAKTTPLLSKSLAYFFRASVTEKGYNVVTCSQRYKTFFFFVTHVDTK
jgi:hypothetical protein